MNLSRLSPALSVVGLSQRDFFGAAVLYRTKFVGVEACISQYGRWSGVLP